MPNRRYTSNYPKYFPMEAHKISLIGTLILVSIVVCQAQFFTYPKSNPVELGKVAWIRDYDLAIKTAKEKKMPILILFQEVPGCSNCTTFGNGILSHPLIVEAIETSFVPLCIYNNKGGKDKQILDQFQEPAWNNPVVRIINSSGKDLVPRQPSFSSTTKVVSTIISGIHSAGGQAPKYLELVLEETKAKESKSVDEAYFSMYCFWSGEKEIGKMEGVLATEAGFMHGKEVVKITFNDSKVKLKDIYSEAKSVGCADQVYGHIDQSSGLQVKPISKYTKDKEDKYYLSKSKYKTIPMTELQKTRVNSTIARSENPDNFLSPRQLSILNNTSYTQSLTSSMIENVWFK